MGKWKQKYKGEWEKEYDGTEEDGVKRTIGEWCSSVKDDEFSGYCKPCNTKISVASGGKKAIEQHAKGSKHTDLMRKLKKTSQRSIVSYAKPSTSSEDATLSAEMRWAAFLAENDLPMFCLTRQQTYS